MRRRPRWRPPLTEGKGSFRLRRTRAGGLPQGNHGHLPDTVLVDDEASAAVTEPRMRYSDGGLRFFLDVSFPATREQLFASAVAHGAPREILRAIRTLPDVLHSDRDVPNLYALAGLADFEPDRAPWNEGQG